MADVLWDIFLDLFMLTGIVMLALFIVGMIKGIWIMIKTWDEEY